MADTDLPCYPADMRATAAGVPLGPALVPACLTQALLPGRGHIRPPDGESQAPSQPFHFQASFALAIVIISS